MVGLVLFRSERPACRCVARPRLVRADATDAR